MILRACVRLFRVNPGLIPRCASSTAAQPSSTLQEGSDFKMVYRFPYIVGVKALCRMKLYQTAFTTVLVPGAVVGNLNGLFPSTTIVAAVLANTLALGMLYVMGEFFRRLVGIVYVNERTQEVKIAHLTFFGSRRDLVVPLQDVVPFPESEDNPSDIYFRLKRYSTDDTYYMSFRFGGVKDRELLEKSLGSLDTDRK